MNLAQIYSLNRFALDWTYNAENTGFIVDYSDAAKW